MKKRIISLFAVLVMIFTALSLNNESYAASGMEISGAILVGSEKKSGITLDLYNKNEKKLDTTTTDSKGEFKFTVEDGGEYIIRPESGYTYQEGSDENGRVVEVTDGNNLALDDTALMEAITVSGKVTDTSGNALEGMQLLILRGLDAIDNNGITTKEDGSYLFYIKKDSSNSSEISVSAQQTTIKDKTYLEKKASVTTSALSDNFSNIDIQVTQAEVTQYPLVINNISVTSKNQADVLGDGGSVVFDSLDENGDWSPCLTLNNAKLDKLCTGDNAVIVSSMADLVMVFKGENTIDISKDESYSDGILARNLSISGEGGGSLSIKNKADVSSGIMLFGEGSLNINNGVILDIEANNGIVAKQILISGLNTINIKADYDGIKADDYIDMIISNNINIKSGNYGIVSPNISVDDSNLVISAASNGSGGLAISSDMVNTCNFNSTNVSVQADTDSSGKNLETYSDSKQSTYQYISASVQYTEDMTIPITLNVTNKSGESIPATSFKFVVESYPDSSMTSVQKKQLQQMFDNFAEITITPTTVTKEGSLTSYLNIKLTDGARMTAALYGMKLSLASVDSSWDGGKEEYQMIFDYDDDGNFTVTSFTNLASGETFSTASFGLAYTGSSSNNNSSSDNNSDSKSKTKTSNEKKTSSKGKVSEASAVKTGDETQSYYYLVLIGAAASLIVFILKKRSKKRL